MILFYMLNTFYLSSFFPSITFINYVSSYRKKCNLDLLITRVISTSIGLKWGKIDSSQLLNENGDLSFLFYFSKQYLVGNIQGKYQKNSSVTLISEESP